MPVVLSFLPSHHCVPQVEQVRWALAKVGFIYTDGRHDKGSRMLRPRDCGLLTFLLLPAQATPGPHPWFTVCKAS